MSGQDLSFHWDRWERALNGRNRWTRDAWIDLRYEAAKTWSDDELATFEAQNRAASNYNLIRPVVNLCAGIEAQTRSDIHVLPRTSQAVDSADALTKLYKYVDDQNQAGRQISRAFQDAAKVGVGWLEYSYNQDPYAERIKVGRIDPFEIWADANGREPDCSDYLDICRGKFLYPQYLDMLFPQWAGEFGASEPSYDPLSHTADWTLKHNDRPPVGLFNNGGFGSPSYAPGHGLRLGMSPIMQETPYYRVNKYDGLVLAVERWYRQDEWAWFAKFRNGVVLENTPENRPNIARFVISGEAQLVRAITRRIRVAIFVEGQLLQDSPSPYSHQRFPFVPIWAYEDEDGVPMGLVRMLRDPQKEFNARRTHLLKRAINRQIWFEEGAFVDEDDAIQQMARHDGVVKFIDGALSAQKALLRDELASSQVDAELMNGAASYIQDMSGMTAELMGQQTNAQSGKAIQARQAQGNTALFTLFENRDWAQIQGAERVLSMIQDTYTEEQEVRITGSSSGLQFLQINKQDPSSGVILNDVSQGRYDLVISEAPVSPTERADRAERMSQFLSNLDPQIKLLFAQDMAEANDMPSEFIQKLGKVIDQITGANKQQQGPQPVPPKPIVNYKDAPPDIQRQMEAADGYQPSQAPPQADPGTQSQQADVQAHAIKTQQDVQAHAQNLQLNEQEAAHKAVLAEQAHQHHMEQQSHQALLQAITKPPPQPPQKAGNP